MAKEALEMLIALANSSIKLERKQTLSGDIKADSPDEFENWRAENNYKKPDDRNYKVLNGKFTIPIFYEKQKLALFFGTPETELENYLNDRGYSSLEIGRSSHEWAEKLSKYEELKKEL